MCGVSRSRDRVVDTALQMFAEQGYNSVSMRDLAQALGMQAPSLYSHFASKDAMLVAVIGPFVERIHTLLEAIPEAPVPAEERRAWLAQAVELLADNWQQLQLVSTDRTLALHPILGPQLVAIRQGMIDCFTRFGVADPRWAIGVTGAIIYAVLPRTEPIDVDAVVRMAEAFIDAR